MKVVTMENEVIICDKIEFSIFMDKVIIDEDVRILDIRDIKVIRG